MTENAKLILRWLLTGGHTIDRGLSFEWHKHVVTVTCTKHLSAKTVYHIVVLMRDKIFAALE